MDNKQIVYIVDDDEAVREGIEFLVNDMGLVSRGLGSVEEFKLTYRASELACLLLDVRMPGMGGIEFLSELSDEEAPIPTIIITGHGDVPMAAEALKLGAIDFIEKPFRESVLWEAIIKALKEGMKRRKASLRHAELKGRILSLTTRERQVMKLLIAGKSDKQVANEIAITRRAVAFHRASILDKMVFTTIVELATSLARANIDLE